MTTTPTAFAQQTRESCLCGNWAMLCPARGPTCTATRSRCPWCDALRSRPYFCLFLSHLNQVLQFVLGKLFEKQKEMKTSKAFLRSIDQFCIMNADPKGLILESELVPFLTKMGINVRRQHCCSPSACRHCCTLNICLYRSKHLPLSL